MGYCPWSAIAPLLFSMPDFFNASIIAIAPFTRTLFLPHSAGEKQYLCLNLSVYGYNSQII
ncbi:MAG: hypothetical protein VKJ64_08965 [Leptolyngbyaceae bacterium]|nr:hypothetical protein [Leptolyngbyaceae bacterium]